MRITDLAITADRRAGLNEEATYSGVTSLFRRHLSKDLTGADIATWGVPYDLSVTNRPGTRFGPRAIRTASTNLAWAGAAWPWGFDPFTTLSMIDYGDCSFDPGHPENIVSDIVAQTSAILSRVPFLISMGGDHSISYPLIKAHAQVHGPLSLIQLDAHSDTWEEPVKRADHGTMFYHAINEGLINANSSVQLGIRTHNQSDYGCTILDANWVHTQGIDACIQKTQDVVRDTPVYLSLDIDVLDPAFAPGTGTPVCGGLSTWQVQTYLRGLLNINFVGMDLVEVSPPYDPAETTALAAASLLFDFICLHAQQLQLQNA